MQLSNYRIRQMDDGSFNIPFIEFTFRQREGLESRSMVPPQRLGDFSRMSFELCEHRGMLRVPGRPPPLLPARSQVITRSCFDGELPLSWRNLESHEVVASGAGSPFIQVRWQVHDDL